MSNGNKLDDWNKDMLLIGAVSYMIDPEGTKSVARSCLFLFALVWLLGSLILLVTNLVLLNLGGIIFGICMFLFGLFGAIGCSSD